MLEACGFKWGTAMYSTKDKAQEWVEALIKRADRDGDGQVDIDVSRGTPLLRV